MAETVETEREVGRIEQYLRDQEGNRNYDSVTERMRSCGTKRGKG